MELIRQLCEEEKITETIAEIIEAKRERVKLEAECEELEFSRLFQPISSSFSVVYKSVKDNLGIVNSDLKIMDNYQREEEECSVELTAVIAQITEDQRQITDKVSKLEFDVSYHQNFVRAVNDRIKQVEAIASEHDRNIALTQDTIKGYESTLKQILMDIATAREEYENLDAAIYVEIEREKKEREAKELQAQKELAERLEREEREAKERKAKEIRERNELAERIAKETQERRDREFRERWEAAERAAKEAKERQERELQEESELIARLEQEETERKEQEIREQEELAERMQKEAEEREEARMIQLQKEAEEREEAKNTQMQKEAYERKAKKIQKQKEAEDREAKKLEKESADREARKMQLQKEQLELAEKTREVKERETQKSLTGQKKAEGRYAKLVKTPAKNDSTSTEGSEGSVPAKLNLSRSQSFTTAAMATPSRNSQMVPIYRADSAHSKSPQHSEGSFGLKRPAAHLQSVVKVARMDSEKAYLPMQTPIKVEGKKPAVRKAIVPIQTPVKVQGKKPDGMKVNLPPPTPAKVQQNRLVIEQSTRKTQQQLRQTAPSVFHVQDEMDETLDSSENDSFFDD